MLWVPTLVMAGCGGSPQRWTLTVYNDHIHDPIVVRVHTQRETLGIGSFNPSRSRPSSLEDRPMGGLIQVLDPRTCESLAQAEFAPEPSLYVRLNKGMSGEGDWFLRVSEIEPDNAESLPPNFADCEGR
jgi:hypothetical protein